MKMLLTLPGELADEIDQVRGDVPRTVWVRRACEAGLRAAMAPVVIEGPPLTTGATRKRMIRDGKSGAPLQITERWDGKAWKRE